MKILILTNSYLLDAPNKIIAELSLYLKSQGHTISVWSVTSNPGLLLDILNNNRIETTSLRMDSYCSIFCSLYSLRKQINQFKPDIIHATLSRPSFLVALLAHFTKLPPITWTQNGTHEWSECRFLPKTFVFHAFRSLSCRVQKIVAVSNGLQEELIKYGFASDKITTICNGVNTDKFQPLSEDEIQSLRNQLSLPQNAMIIGAAGNHRHVKGYDLLIQACAKIRDRHKNFILLFWGTGPETQNLKRMTETLGIETQVRFLGFERDINKYLGILDVFVQPSRQEAFGLACAEALSCDIPVVVNNIPGLTDLVRSGENGLIADAQDANQFADTICRCYDERKSYRGCRAGILERYSLKMMDESYLRLFEEVIQKS